MREKIGEGYVEARLDTGRLAQDTSAVERSIAQRFQQMGSQLRTTGRQLTTRLTLPIIAMGTGVVKVASDFESSMNRVRALSGAAGDSFDALRTQAQELGRTTQFSAAQAADAMGFLAMAGFDANEILGAMPSTLTLAASAQLDLARSADIVSNVMTGYGIEVEQLDHAVDVLTKSFTSANTDLSQLGDAFKYAGPVAKGAGIEFEEAAAALSLMGNAGIQGTMAGTSLRGALTRLMNPTGEVASKLAELGIEASNADGSLVSLESLVSQLEDSGATTADMMLLFGQRAGPAMAALVEQGSDALTDLTGELKNAGGTAQEIADIQMEGMRGAMLRMKSAAEGAAIAIADTGLLSGLAKFAEGAAGAFQRLSEANPEMLKFGTIVVAAVAAAGPVMWAVGAALSALGVILSPAGLIIGGLVGLGIALVNVVGEGETFVERLTDAFGRLQDFLGPAVSWVTDKISSVAEWFGLTRTTTSEHLGAMAREVDEGTREVAEALGGPHLSGAVLDIMQEFATMRGDVLQELHELSQGIEVALTDAKVRGSAQAADLADEVVENLGKMRQIGVDHYEELRDRGVAAVNYLVEHGAVSEHDAFEMLAGVNLYANEGAAAFERLTTDAEAARDIIGDPARWEAALRQGFGAAVEGAIMQADELAAQFVESFAEMRTGATAHLELMRDEAGQVSLETASEVITNSANQRDQVIAASEEQAAAVIAAAWESYETKGISEETRDGIIAAWRDQHAGVVERAEATHRDVVEQVQGMRSGVEGEIDLLTGNILKGWQKLWRDSTEAHTGMVADIAMAWATLKYRASEVMDGIRDAFASGWGAIQRGAADGTNGLIRIVNGLITGVNRVAGAVGLGDLIPTLGEVSWGHGPTRPQNQRRAGHQEFHEGGVVGRDGKPTSPHLRPGERWIKALDGEEVLTADDPRHIGHLGSPVNLTEVGGIRSAIAATVRRVGEFTSDVASRVRRVVANSARPLVEAAMGRIDGAAAGYGPVGRVGGAAVRRTGDAVLDWIAGMDTAAAERESQLGSAHLGGSGTGTARLVAAFRSSGLAGRFTSGYRPGDPGYHGRAMAADFAGPTPSPRPTPAMGRIFDYFARYGNLRELIYNGRPWNVIGGRSVPTTSLRPELRRAHNNHVHVAALANGGVITEPTLGLLGESARTLPEIVTPQKVMADTFEGVLGRMGPMSLDDDTIRRLAAASAEHLHVVQTADRAVLAREVRIGEVKLGRSR